MSLYSFIGPLIRMFPAETAHNLAIWSLENDIVPLPEEQKDYPELRQKIWNLDFKHPVGLAAGFDKNGRVTEQVLKQGFAFTEVGSVTPQPQEGNPKPRLFRLEKDAAVINRMGFNNDGAGVVLPRVKRMVKQNPGAIVGVNLGKNKTTVVAEADYVMLLNQFYPIASYLVINVSSPNTPGLRDLQKREALDELLGLLMREKSGLRQQHQREVPLLIKISPDIDELSKGDVADLARQHKVDGLVISNTSTQRPNLESRHKDEIGGLSGKPITEWSTRLIGEMFRFTEGQIPIIGVGGVSNGLDAYEKIRAGASLVQLYTALVYQGFDVIERIKQELSDCLKRDGFASIRDAIGADHEGIVASDGSGSRSLDEALDSYDERTNQAIADMVDGTPGVKKEASASDDELEDVDIDLDIDSEEEESGKKSKGQAAA